MNDWAGCVVPGICGLKKPNKLWTYYELNIMHQVGFFNHVLFLRLGERYVVLDNNKHCGIKQLIISFLKIIIIVALG